METRMRSVRIVGLATVLSFGLAACVAAQSGGGSSGGGSHLSDRVQISYEQRYTQSPAEGRSDWMQYIVMWRGQPGWQVSRGASLEQQKESERIYREASAAATLAGRSIMGSFGAGG